VSIDGERPQVDVLLPTPTAELREAHLADAGVRLWLKRADLIHPDLPGNKCRKLKYNLVAAAEQGHSTLFTFGGAYSNHIRATAAAGQLLGLATIGMIRGEEHLPLRPRLRRGTRDAPDLPGPPGLPGQGRPGCPGCSA
jgi:1-aminocyclopropane-1-carboxylate deaminase